MATMQSIASTGLGKAPSVGTPKARTVKEACRALGISRSTLYRLAGEGRIRVIHIAGRTLIAEAELDRVASEGA
jgi:excisionase family DNA binding protein